MPSKAITTLINTYKPINTITITAISSFPNYSVVLCSFSASIHGEMRSSLTHILLFFLKFIFFHLFQPSGNCPILLHFLLWSPWQLVSPLEASLGHLTHLTGHLYHLERTVAPESPIRCRVAKSKNIKQKFAL